jgi:hypothetical protein
MFLRVRALGLRVVFAPAATVDHVGAPHVSGQRFDWRYMFWSRRNHALLLARNFGLASPQFGKWVTVSLREILRPPGDGGTTRRMIRVFLGFVALAAGLATSVRKARLRPGDPRRTDQTGERIASALAVAPDWGDNIGDAPSF